jgi:TRAP-type uncharacterized transport system substrate-binding protein
MQLLAALGVLALVAIAWVVGGRHALPPRAIVMATGPEGGSYAAFGARYRKILERNGLEVRLRPTAGDGENLALLEDPRSGVSVAFLQSGTTTEATSPDLTSLGSVFLQPVWLFQRRGSEGTVRPGARISIGPEGSGTRAMMKKLQGLLGPSAQRHEWLALPPDRAAEELQAGRIDAMALVASWESPLVHRLLTDPDIGLATFQRADAFVALDPSLEKRVLPMGVADLARNLPPRDVSLLATKASLVVRRDLHAAVQYLLIEAASEIHGGPGVFQKAGQFPAAEGVDLPLSEDARRFYRSGRPFLQRYLPYWMAVLVERILLVLVPVIGLAMPLLRVGPMMYRRMIELRIVRLYGELKLIETYLEGLAPSADGAELARRVTDLETRAGHLRVPIRFAPLLYTLKQHIALVRSRLQERSG